jgi:hypothetical protein
MRLWSRATYLIATFAFIGIGLLTRVPAFGLPRAIAKYSGSIIWGAMVYFAVASLLPRQSLSRRTALTAIIAVATEFSQLIHTSWLDAFRQTTIGVLLIGRFFSWWDIASYLIGIAGAATIDGLILRRHRT